MHHHPFGPISPLPPHPHTGHNPLLGAMAAGAHHSDSFDAALGPSAHHHHHHHHPGQHHGHGPPSPPFHPHHHPFGPFGPPPPSFGMHGHGPPVPPPPGMHHPHPHPQQDPTAPPGFATVQLPGQAPRFVPLAALTIMPSEDGSGSGSGSSTASAPASAPSAPTHVAPGKKATAAGGGSSSSGGSTLSPKKGPVAAPQGESEQDKERAIAQMLGMPYNKSTLAPVAANSHPHSHSLSPARSVIGREEHKTSSLSSGQGEEDMEEEEEGTIDGEALETGDEASRDGQPKPQQQEQQQRISVFPSPPLGAFKLHAMVASSPAPAAGAEGPGQPAGQQEAGGKKKRKRSTEENKAVDALLSLLGNPSGSGVSHGGVPPSSSLAAALQGATSVPASSTTKRIKL